jgi:hypothetical protein
MQHRMHKPILLVLLLAAACESHDGSIPDATASIPDAGRIAADAGSCVTARYLVDCSNPGGGGEGCLSAIQECPGYAATSCESQCADDEYAVACADGTLPSGCRAQLPDPSGTAYGCCPVS